MDAFISEIIQEADHTNYLDIAKMLLTNRKPEELVAAILRHAYEDEFLPQNYTEINEVMSERNGYNNDSRSGRRDRNDRHSDRLEDQTKLFIALGKKDNMNPKSLLELLHTKAKTPARKVRDIRILDNFSFITVPFDEAEIIMRTINKGGGERPLITKAKK